VPDAWCSTSSIENRNDPDSSNEDQISYIDVWGVPGDSPALLDQKLELNYSSATTMIIVGKIDSGKHLASSVPHFINSTDFTITSSSTQTDATRIGGSYERITSTQSITAEASSWAALATGAKKVYLIARTDGGTPSAKLITSLGLPSVNTEPVTLVLGGGNFSLHDLGTMHFSEGANLFSTIHTAGTTPGIEFQVTNTGGDNVDLDAIALMPGVDDSVIISVCGDTNNNAYIYGTHKLVFNSELVGPVAFTGGLWTLSPNKLTRLVYLSKDDNATDIHHLNDTQTVTLTITPRSRHLLGVI
jgi:hypothetical protein